LTDINKLLVKYGLNKYELNLEDFRLD